MASSLNEICGRCGLTFGSHHAGRAPNYTYNQCPGHEGQMDWNESPGTVFKHTGKYKLVQKGQEAKNA